MIELKITGDNITDIQKQLQGLVSTNYQVKVNVPQANLTEGITKAAEKAQAPAPAEEKAPEKTEKKATKKKASKKSSSKKASPVQTEKEDTSGSISQEDVYAALQKVSAEKGLPAAKKVLNDCGADRISALEEDKFEEFLAACEAACAAE